MLTQQEQADLFKLAEKWVKSERLRIRAKTGFKGSVSLVAAERIARKLREQFKDSLKEVG